MTIESAFTAMPRLSAALLTAVGRGAVATIRICGDLAELDHIAVPLFRAANGRPLSEQQLRRIAFGHWGRSDVEEVVVCRIAANTLEIHCHGGDAAVRRILDDLQQSGCAIMTWQAQTASQSGPFEAECLDALSRATTWRTAEILLEQVSGVLQEAFSSFSPSLPPPLSPSQTLAQLDALLEWSDFGIHLTRPWSVVLTGRPNVGKSSLINRLLGYERAIVFDRPGTTRDVVTAETAFDGWPILLCDTAGLRDSAEELEAAGMALARRRLDEADLRLVLIDLSEPPTADDERLLAQWSEAIVVAHKSDLHDCWRSACPSAAIRVSSVTGEGLAVLQQRLVERLIPRVPPPGTPIPVTARQVGLLQTARSALASRDKFDAEAEYQFMKAISRLMHDPVE